MLRFSRARKHSHLIAGFAMGFLFALASLLLTTTFNFEQEQMNAIASRAVCQTFDALVHLNNSLNCTCFDSVTDRSFDFCYHFAGFSGKKFDCSLLMTLRRLNLLYPDYDTKPIITEQVFITASSSDHIEELIDHIGSTTEYFSSQNNWKMIVFDLGLTEREAIEVKKYCHVEYRRFNFSNYPEYVKNLKNYRWKPIIIAEALLEFRAFWWSDNSVRWNISNLSSIYEAVRNQKFSSFLLQEPVGHNNFITNNPGMYKYFPTDIWKQTTTEAYAAGHAFVARTMQSAEFIKWWIMCALEEDCMEPPGSKLNCTSLKKIEGHYRKYKDYANCHRYDQSAINLILANYFQHDTRKYTAPTRVGAAMRGSVGKYTLKTCS